MSGFVVISRNQALLHSAVSATSRKPVPTFRLSPPCPNCSPIPRQEVSNRSCPACLQLPARAYRRRQLGSHDSEKEPLTLQSTIWTTSHNGQHTRHVIHPLDSTLTSCAPACSLLILVVTAVYTAGHSSWPLTGPSTVTSGAARPCTFALSLKPTPTSASPDNRE
jgi:hypothetical protein